MIITSILTNYQFVLVELMMAQKNKQSHSVSHSNYVLLENEMHSFPIQYVTAKEIEKDNIQKQTALGIFIMIFGAVCYSLLVVIVKWASNLGYESMQILIFKASTQIIIAIPFPSL